METQEAEDSSSDGYGSNTENAGKKRAYNSDPDVKTPKAITIDDKGKPLGPYTSSRKQLQKELSISNVGDRARKEAHKSAAAEGDVPCV